MIRTVAVTGAAGFVGGHLCTTLLRAGMQVRALVRTESPALVAADFATDRLQQIALGDIGASTELSGALAGADALVHLAGRVHVRRAHGRAERDRFRAANVDATLRVAQAAAQARLARVVFVSSAKALGDEAASDPYSWSKAEAERTLVDAARELGLECVIVQPPLVYGPGVRANFLRLMRVVDAGIPIPLARVHNRRSLVYVGNLADALHACCAHPAAPGQTFCVSDGEDVSTAELVSRIAHALGRAPRLFALAPSLLELAARLTGQSETLARLTGDLSVDSAPVRTMLGWTPPYTMEQGLAETAAWYRAQASGGLGQTR